MHKYIGRVFNIIYMDRKGSITKRRIRVISIEGDRMRAYCHTSGGPRMLLLANILAAEPVKAGA